MMRSYDRINSRIQPLRVCRANALKDSFVIMTGEIKCSLRSRLISCCHDKIRRIYTGIKMTVRMPVITMATELTAA